MELLEARIRQDGRVLSPDILKVDSFLNQQLDVQLFLEMAKEWRRLFADAGVNKLLTIEAGGIGLAAVTGLVFGCPVVFAKKSRSRNMAGGVYAAEVHSFTHGTVCTAQVSETYLSASDRLLLIDDFLANGAALDGLLSIAAQAGASVAGAGIAVEKAFQGGGDRIRARGVRVEALARIASMSPETGIRFC